ncbi:MAG: class I SAM-dependent methyltransferase [Anaerolineae bacterium]|jgi:SAM-dependent methyltransferase
MERAEWLRQMQDQTEELYDHLSPLYWVEFGLYANETHLEFLRKLLDRVPPESTLLSAACGAGRYDGLLLDAGHGMVGIDLSAGMLARARERFPGARYEKMGLQEMDFREAFEGAICIDAMEHVCPEAWPGILRRFRESLKPGGVLYFTLELADASELEEAFAQAGSRGLPVVYGEVVSEMDLADERVQASGASVVSGELASKTVYHYYPSLEQVRTWIREAGFGIEDEGMGNGYEHFVVRRQ